MICVNYISNGDFEWLLTTILRVCHYSTLKISKIVNDTERRATSLRQASFLCVQVARIVTLTIMSSSIVVPYSLCSHNKIRVYAYPGSLTNYATRTTEIKALLPPTKEATLLEIEIAGVCLSVCLLARLLKNAWMDLDKMLRVDRCRDTEELINFWARAGS